MIALILILAFDANITWTNATAFEDGTLISAATGEDVVSTTKVVYGTCTSTGGFGTQTGETSVPWPVTTVVVTGIPSGKYCFRARHMTVGGVNSAWSSVVSKTYSRTPRRPTAVTVP